MARSGVLATVASVSGSAVTVVIEGDPTQTAIPARVVGVYSPAVGDPVSLSIRHPLAPQIQGKVS